MDGLNVLPHTKDWRLKVKVIIAGSRTITSTVPVSTAITMSGLQITEVVSGGARGPDQNGELWACFQQGRVTIKRFIPDWDTHGKKAGFMRNREMAHYAEALIAIFDGQSHGTAHMIRYMYSLGKPVFVYEPARNDGHWWRLRHHTPAHPVALCRGTIGKASGIDITVKSAMGTNREFAPTWEMVRGHQTHTMSNQEYTRLYTAILDALPIQAWRKLTHQMQGGILTFLCYCEEENVDGGRKFCHSHLIVEYMLKRWPMFFRDARP